MLLLALAHALHATLKMFTLALAHALHATLYMLMLALAHAFHATLQKNLLAKKSFQQPWLGSPQVQNSLLPELYS